VRARRKNRAGFRVPKQSLEVSGRGHHAEASSITAALPVTPVMGVGSGSALLLLDYGESRVAVSPSAAKAVDENTPVMQR